jgi:hypothetical protein
MALSFGGCRQNYNSAESSVEVYNNVTKTTDYLGGVPISPYIRPNEERFFPACATLLPCNSASVPDCGIANPADILCSTGIISQGFRWNCFADTNTTTSLADCYQFGWKGVVANKYWQGKVGYTEREHGVADSMAYNGTCIYHAEDVTPTQKRYLSQAVTARVETFSAAYGDVWIYGEYDVTNTINRYSGVTSNTCVSSSNAGTIYGDPLMDQYMIDSATALLSYLDTNITEVVGTIANRMAGLWPSPKPIPDPPDITNQTGDNSFVLTWQTTDSYGNVVPSAIVTIDADFSFVLDWYGHWTISGDWGQIGQETLEFTNTSVHYNKLVGDGYFGGTLEARTEYDLLGTLSNPYTAEELKQDVINLLSKWNMADNITYPWRQDPLNTLTQMPLVTYDETIGTFMNCGADANATTYSGEILGEPVEGFVIDHYWDWRHENWNECSDMFGTYTYVESFGMYSGQNGVPTNATQWTNKNQAANLPVGGAYWYLWGNTLYAQKFAETIIPKPAFNYARPCGVDRFAYSASYNCITSIVGTTVNLEPTAPATTLVTNDVCSVYDSTGPVGTYRITKTDGYTLQLTTLLISGSQMTEVLPYREAVIFKNRYQGYVPPVCGRVALTQIDNLHTPITCSVVETLYLCDNDQIQIRDTQNSSPVNGVWTIRVVTSSSFALVGSVSGSTQYVIAANNPNYLYSLYAPKWQWNSSASMGTYGFRGWNYDYQDGGEYTRLLVQYATWSGSCVGYPTPRAEHRPYQSTNGLPQAVTDVGCSTYIFSPNPCVPNVAYISPNVEAFISGRNHGFGDVTPNTKYGTFWQAAVEQWDTDYLYMTPPCPCEYDAGTNTYDCQCAWLADNGTCQTDDPGIPCTNYYPMRPFIEYRCEPPVGYPSLPAGVYVGCLTQPQVDVVGVPNGNVCVGPSNLSPWAILANEMSCVCGNGRFAADYIKNGVGCDYIETI